MSNRPFSTPNPMDGMLGQKLSSVRIGKRFVGEGYPVYIIGEVGLNHCGNLAKAIELIDIAADVTGVALAWLFEWRTRRSAGQPKEDRR